MSARGWGALALAATLLAPACGAAGGEEAGPSTTRATATTAEATTTTTSLPPGGRRPTADEPLRILMAGDSLMADISLAIASTVQDGGAARARLVAAPSVPRDDVTRELWRRQLRTYDPEVIVVLIGVWEGMAEDALASQPLGSLAWEQTYRSEALDPYLELLTSEGAEVVWIGMPPVLHERRQLGFRSMNRAVRRLARTSEDLVYIPGDTILADRAGAWTEFLPGPDGQPQRVRRVDTTHLCAEGAVRLARPVLSYLVRNWEVPIAPRWPDRDWRWVFPPEDCPPA